MFDVPNILPIYLCWEQTRSQKVFTEFICDKSKWMMLIFSGIQWSSAHRSNLDLSAWCPKYFESLQPMMTCPPPCRSRLKQLISKKLFFLHILHLHIMIIKYNQYLVVSRPRPLSPPVTRNIFPWTSNSPSSMSSHFAFYSSFRFWRPLSLLCFWKTL